MALTGRNLLDRLAEMEGRDFASWTEAMKLQRVGHVNAALRWAWRTEDPLFAFPFTVTTATINLVSGAVPIASLGEGTWCALATADPRPESASYRWLDAYTTNGGVYPRCVGNAGSVFAFYRVAVPQLTYAADSEYPNPSNIPDQLLDMVSLKALYTLKVALQEWEAVNALQKSYGDPARNREDLVVAARNSNLIWEGHELALAPAVA